MSAIVGTADEPCWLAEACSFPLLLVLASLGVLPRCNPPQVLLSKGMLVIAIDSLTLPHGQQ